MKEVNGRKKGKRITEIETERKKSFEKKERKLRTTVEQKKTKTKNQIEIKSKTTV